MSVIKLDKYLDHISTWSWFPMAIAAYKNAKSSLSEIDISDKAALRNTKIIWSNFYSNWMSVRKNAAGGLNSQDVAVRNSSREFFRRLANDINQTVNDLKASIYDLRSEENREKEETSKVNTKLQEEVENLKSSLDRYRVPGTMFYYGDIIQPGYNAPAMMILFFIPTLGRVVASPIDSPLDCITIPVDGPNWRIYRGDKTHATQI